MPLELGTQRMLMVLGDNKPVEISLGENKISGWEEATATGQNVTADNTYNDAVHVEVQGNTELQSDYMECWGGSVQDGTPSPSTPIDITPLVTAGTYKITTDCGIYEVTVPDLHGIGDVTDKVVFDAISGEGYLDAKILTKAFDGTEDWTGFVLSTDGAIGRAYCDNINYNVAQGDEGICTHLVWTKRAQAPTDIGFWFSWDNRILIALQVETIEEFKALLSTQYSAGTPVTVIYQAETPIRTPLAFAKVTSSTAPELPLHVFEDGTTTPPTSNTPSIDYPQTIVPASGTLETSCGDKQSTQQIPPLYGVKNTDGTWAARDKMVIDDVTNTAWIERGVVVKAFDGTENIKLYTYQGQPNSFSYDFGTITAKPYTIMCSHYPRNAITSFIFSKDGCQNGALVAIIHDTNIATVAEFKAFLTAQHSAGTPVTIAYCAATPTIEPIDYTAAKTYYPQTVIELTSNLPMDMTTKYKHF